MDINLFYLQIKVPPKIKHNKIKAFSNFEKTRLRFQSTKTCEESSYNRQEQWL